MRAAALRKLGKVMACEIAQNYIQNGKLALELRDLESATENFSKALMEDDYNEPEYWCLLAESLFYQAQFESSLACWKEAAMLNPVSKKIWVRISALYALMEQDDLAIQYYELSEGLPIE